MSDITIVVDCNDADFARDICAALQQFPDVTALLPHHQAARDAQYASCWFPDPQLLTRSPGLKLIQAASAGAVLINCGRGEHMVNDDVLAALESGQLAGAVLDVFPQEPLPADDPLWRHPQVVITPHMASAAPAEVIARQLLENIQRQRRGLPLKNLVNKHAGY